MARPKETKKQRLTKLVGALRQERSSFEPHWRELAEHIQPRRISINQQSPNKGDKRSQKLIDSTPALAARTLQAGLMSHLTSPGKPWFRLATTNQELAESTPVKLWLEDVRRIIADTFAKSNLYQALPLLYTDMIVFATAAMMLVEDDETAIRCVNFTVGEYCLALDEKLRVRTFTREFQMTVRQLVERFRGDGEQPDWSRFAKSTRTAWENGELETWVKVVHVVQPGDAYDPSKLHAKHKQWSECYYEVAADDDTLLEEKGYDEWPLLAARWEVSAGDVYGTNSPGMTALGDCKQLQYGEKLGMKALEKMVNPPMIAPVSMRNQKLSVVPGDVTYEPEPNAVGQGFRPAQTVDFRLDLLEGKQQQVRQRISRAFLEDLILLLDNLDERQRTATEIVERKEEKLLALGPVFGQFTQDVPDQLIDRTFAILVRQGKIPPAPPEMEGMELKIDYVSALAISQRAIGRGGLEAFAAFVGNLATVKQDPTLWDKVDTDQMVDEAGEMYGVTPKIIVGDEKVAEVRDARNAAQAQQAQVEQIAAAAPAVAQLASADTSGKNALTDIIGNIGGQVAA